MGKMKDKFMEEQERLVSEAVNAFIDDDWQYQEYLKSLSERMGLWNTNTCYTRRCTIKS